MVLVTELVWDGHDNTIDLALLVDDEAADLSGVTRMKLAIGEVVIDSASQPAVFDWSAGDGKVILALGGQGLAAGRHKLRLVVYMSGYPNGLVWGEILVIVKI